MVTYLHLLAPTCTHLHQSDVSLPGLHYNAYNTTYELEEVLITASTYIGLALLRRIAIDRDSDAGT